MLAYSRWKYTILFASMLLVVTSRMALPGSGFDSVILDGFSSIMVVVAILTICTERHFRLLALILGSPVIVLLSLMYVVPAHLTAGTHLAGRIMAVLFLGFTVVMIVRAVLTTRFVTWDTVVGAFSGYVLIGVVWTQIYCALDLIDRQAFAVSGTPLDVEVTVLERQAVLEYFSFATLSTVGYGDVAPVSQPARSLATFEAICGQFYLAVLVAGLIGIRTTGTHPDQPMS
jgi:hypothetical protein